MSPVVTLAAEGPSDIPILRRIVEFKKAAIGPIYIKNGKSGLDKQLKAYNAASMYAVWLVVRDLDNDHDCPGYLARDLIPTPQKYMCFRIAVRSIEAWILSDRSAFASYYGVSESLVPNNPDELSNPKQTLINLARRSSKRYIRENVPPAVGSISKVGPDYVTCIEEFASYWQPNIAAKSSPSLKRCLAALEQVLRSSNTK